MDFGRTFWSLVATAVVISLAVAWISPSDGGAGCSRTSRRGIGCLDLGPLAATGPYFGRGEARGPGPQLQPAGASLEKRLETLEGIASSWALSWAGWPKA